MCMSIQTVIGVLQCLGTDVSTAGRALTTPVSLRFAQIATADLAPKNYTSLGICLPAKNALAYSKSL